MSACLWRVLTRGGAGAAAAATAAAALVPAAAVLRDRLAIAASRATVRPADQGHTEPTIQLDSVRLGIYGQYTAQW
jgi:hypothetical protein